MDNGNSVEKIIKRTGEIDAFLTEFINTWNSIPNSRKISCKEKAAEAIATIYFEIVNSNVKGEYFKNDGHLNRYKVASGTEIACMLFRPLQLTDPYLSTDENNTKVNAQLATYLAIQLLYSIHFKDVSKFPKQTTNQELLFSLGSHTYWVRYFDENKAYPVYLNSTFWQMYLSAIILEQEKKILEHDKNKALGI